MTPDDLKNARWTLIVEFDSLEVALESGDYGRHVGESAVFVQWLIDAWGLDWDDMDEIEWVDDTVKVNVDVVDCLINPMQWLPMHTIPKRIELVRNEERS